MYKKSVAIVVWDSPKNLCLAGKRSGKHAIWQFPQGDVDAHETCVQAAQRELFEEMGIKGYSSLNYCDSKLSIDVQCIADIPQARCDYFQRVDDRCVEFVKYSDTYNYDYPVHVKRVERGKAQMWFLAVKKNDAPLNIKINYEFCDYAWMSAHDILSNIVDFKKDVYEKGLAALGLI